MSPATTSLRLRSDRAGLQRILRAESGRASRAARRPSALRQERTCTLSAPVRYPDGSYAPDETLPAKSQLCDTQKSCKIGKPIFGSTYGLRTAPVALEGEVPCAFCLRPLPVPVTSGRFSDTLRPFGNAVTRFALHQLNLRVRRLRRLALNSFRSPEPRNRNEKRSSPILMRRRPKRL